MNHTRWNSRVLHVSLETQAPQRDHPLEAGSQGERPSRNPAAACSRIDHPVAVAAAEAADTLAVAAEAADTEPEPLPRNLAEAAAAADTVAAASYWPAAAAAGIEADPLAAADHSGPEPERQIHPKYDQPSSNSLEATESRHTRGTR